VDAAPEGQHLILALEQTCHELICVFDSILRSASIGFSPNFPMASLAFMRVMTTGAWGLCVSFWLIVGCFAT